MKEPTPQGYCPAFDAYIAESAEFARPILERLRALFHKACPEVREVLKWSFPHFEYQGLLGSMASFKQHVSFGFWKGQLMSDPHGLFRGVGKTTMNALRLESLDDLPPDKVILSCIKEAMRLNEEGIRLARVKKPAAKKKPLAVPADLLSALRKNKQAQSTFEAFSPSHKKEYVDWIAEAKQTGTRQKRLETAIAWMSEGKPRHWKYMRK